MLGFGGRTVLRECVLEWDEDWGFQIHRYRITISLGVYLERPVDDVNRWFAAEQGGAVGFNSSSGERRARDIFVQSYLRLKAKLNDAEAKGMFTKSEFTIGTFSSDQPGIL